MDIAGILDLFGHSVYDPRVEAMLARCKASHDKTRRIDRYGSINSEPLGVEFWFWWKGYYRDQIGDPQPPKSARITIEAGSGVQTVPW